MESACRALPADRFSLGSLRSDGIILSWSILGVVRWLYDGTGTTGWHGAEHMGIRFRGGQLQTLSLGKGPSGRRPLALLDLSQSNFLYNAGNENSEPSIGGMPVGVYRPIIAIEPRHAAISYREMLPHPALREQIQCYWTLKATLPPGAKLLHRVIPDGCMDILVDLGTRQTRVVGTMRSPDLVVLAGAVDPPFRTPYILMKVNVKDRIYGIP